MACLVFFVIATATRTALPCGQALTGAALYGLLAVAGIAPSLGSLARRRGPDRLPARGARGVGRRRRGERHREPFPTKRSGHDEPVATALGGVSLALGEQWILPQSGRVWASMAWVTVAGSVVVGLFLFVLKRWTASATTYALPLMPVVAVGLGVLLAGRR